MLKLELLLGELERREVGFACRRRCRRRRRRSCSSSIGCALLLCLELSTLLVEAHLGVVQRLAQLLDLERLGCECLALFGEIALEQQALLLDGFALELEIDGRR